MSWLMRVIGRVLGTTQTVTLACQTQDGLTGGNNNTAVEQHSANKELKPKRSNVKQGTQVKSRKQETSCVRTPTKKSSTRGTQQATPVPQSAKQKPKSPKKAAPKATQGKSSKPATKSVRKTTG